MTAHDSGRRHGPASPYLEETPMITEQDITTVIGSNAVDNDGDKLGKIGQVYLDDQTGRPEWATVNTGLFGTHESFVPLAEATVSGGTLRVPYEKARVKDAPRVSAEQGHLSPDEEAELYRYYGVGGYDTTGTTTGTDTAGTAGYETTGTPGPGTPGSRTPGPGTAGTAAYETTGTGTAGYTDSDTSRQGTVGHDTSGPTTDDAMTRSEEQLRVGTQQVQAGR